MKGLVYIQSKLHMENDPYVNKIYRMVVDILKKYELGAANYLSDVNASKVLFAISIGGDGTMIHTLKQATQFNKSVMGINLGNVGFLADTPPDVESIEKIINQIMSQSNQLDQRIMLNTNLDWNDAKMNAWSLNEIVVSNIFSDTVIKYDLFIDEMKTGTFTSNSIMVSTPTGSTAYALNVGGGILAPQSNAIEIIPVAAQSYTSSMKPIIVDASAKIRIRLHLSKDRDNISMKSDGIEVFGQPATADGYADINIERNNSNASIIHTDDWNFFKILNTKLGWNK